MPKKSSQIRDPIHGLISFQAGSAVDHILSELINTPEFQRLRRIRQLGFSEITFPGATHSRFSHSLGVANNARRFISRIRQIDTELIDEESEVAIVSAALLHDIGHGPFSHAFERISKENHESRTVEAILDPSTKIYAALTAFDPALPQRVAAFFPEAEPHFRFLTPTDVTQYAGSIPLFQRSIVSSQLDADRFDYLVRDSHFCGVTYGNFDNCWLLSNLSIDATRKRFAINEKGLFAVESYIFARYHMYQAVYFHKATRSAEAMLIAAFERSRRLLQDGDDPSRFLPGVPAELLAVLKGDRLSLQSFLGLDDFVATQFVHSCSRSSDPDLVLLGDGLRNRRLFKSASLPHLSKNDPEKFADARERAKESVEAWAIKNGFSPASCWRTDTMKNTPYSIYDPDKESDENTQIYIQLGDGTFSELSRISQLVDTLRDKVVTSRWHFPVDCRELVQERLLS